MAAKVLYQAMRGGYAVAVVGWFGGPRAGRLSCSESRQESTCLDSVCCFVLVRASTRVFELLPISLPKDDFSPGA